MENAREFDGKTLEEAIDKACGFFDAPREKLEIEIVQDAKSGIFGLVGVRKAVIMASLAPVAARISDILVGTDRGNSGTQAHARAETPEPRTAHSSTENTRQDKRRKPPRPAQNVASSRPQPQAHADGASSSAQEGRSARRHPQRDTRNEQPAPKPHAADVDLPEDEGAESTYVSIKNLDQDLLRSTVLEVVRNLIAPIAEGAALELEIGEGRVAVHIRSGEDLGLLIGREGQTLACLQYLANRIVARRMGSPVRVQFDAGDYRERQDEKLRELALLLAERAKTTGRVCPTRPLSSYQRRIVHMALQGDPSIQTRSSGEGPLKRVVIQRAKTEQ